jgi:hypothetical protein
VQESGQSTACHSAAPTRADKQRMSIDHDSLEEASSKLKLCFVLLEINLLINNE